MARAASLDTSSVIARAQRSGGAKVIALNLGPLLAPHRKHGRLSLRIERLPQQARFSRGSRNNDGSWSLATDELEDLAYQLPENFDQAHTLAIRIISLVGGNTLAVLEHPIAPGGHVDDAQTATDGAAADAQAHALSTQLAQMKAALAAREVELAQAREAVERSAATPATPAAPVRDVEAEVAVVRAELKAEFDSRLAGVGTQAAAELQKQRAGWASELEARVATVQRDANAARDAWQREAQEKLKAAESERMAAAQAEWSQAKAKALDDLRAELTAAYGRSKSDELEVVREKLQREAHEALTRAQQSWTAAEATRLAAAEGKWREDAAQAAAATESGRAGEIEKLRATQARETQEALTRAEDTWKVGEAVRLAAKETEWREAAAQTLAEAQAKVQAVAAGSNNDELAALREDMAALQAKLAARDGALAEAQAKMQTAAADGDEIAALREDLAALQAKLAARDGALAEAQKAADALRASAQRDTQDALAKAAADWQSQEAARLAAAQTQWRAEAEKALTFVRSEPHAGDDEVLRNRVAALETLLADRDAALAEAREVIERQTLAANQKSQKTRKGDDAARLADAEAGWRSSYGNALGEATARYEAAEAALAQVRIRTKDDGRTLQELAATRAALAAREKELADMRAIIAPLDGQGPEDGNVSEAQPDAKPRPYSRVFIGGVIAAAIVLAACIVFYPSLEALLFGAPHVSAPQAAPAPKDEVRLPPAAVPETKAILLRDARLRAEASASAKVVATVTRGSEVIVLEPGEKWTRVRFNGDKSIEGWVGPSALKEVPKE